MTDSKCLGDGVCTNPTCPTHGVEWTFDGAPTPIERVSGPPKPFMKPGTKVSARRFGREILAKVTASGGSTFTVAALDEDDYTVWQDMTFADVTIVEVPT